MRRQRLTCPAPPRAFRHGARAATRAWITQRERGAPPLSDESRFITAHEIAPDAGVTEF
jgi:hypothetical protein